MPLTKRNRLLDRKTNARDARLILIATEGQETETQYFTIFRNPKIKVVVIPTTDGKSAPVYVLERLDAIKKQYELEPDDMLWLMIDIDHRRSPEISKICRLAKQKGFDLAVSNPCFELWLYLHVAENVPPEIDCAGVERELRNVLGSYNKSHLDLDKYKKHIHLAIGRAKSLQTNLRERWPSSIGTHVYKVVERLV